MDAATEFEGKRPSSKEIIEIFRDRLKTNLKLYFPELSAAETIIKGTSIGGVYAQTFRFDISTGSVKKVVYVKICPIFKRLNPGILEYETLQRLYHKMPGVNAACAVARPLDFFQDLNAYAMESVGDSNFKTYLLKNNSRFCRHKSLKGLILALSGCAKWLRTFHDITHSSNPQKFDSSSFLDSIKEDLDYRSLYSFRFKTETLNKLDIVLNNLSYLNGRYLLPCAKWHWDYTPAHIFLDNNQISVIDITGIDNVPIYEDIGHFLAALITVNNLPFYPTYDRKRANDLLCKEFINGYCGGKPDEEFILFTNIYKLKYLILWFHAQKLRVSETIHPAVGKAFANYRLVRLFEHPLQTTTQEILKRLKT